ncbi:hypothetical protein FNV43_RR02404 [Rhamnella rubrinervis]|uniref:F-box domain-containing protein n=1 Tax=Rhamnella rubrinervis TaxID=2594499 RepID=A0A8K0MU01_9ROSA|nr:hypothetical protein FNV43_RR02404 [Rhamnella rubrinervis]
MAKHSVQQNWSDLPRELLELIFRRLAVIDTLRVKAVCPELCGLCFATFDTKRSTAVNIRYIDFDYGRQGTLSSIVVDKGTSSSTAGDIGYSEFHRDQ